MPSSLHGYQRLILRGVPVWKKDDNVYLYDIDVGTNPIHIGTVSGGFKPDWLDSCQARLNLYQTCMVSRTRSSAPSKKK